MPLYTPFTDEGNEAQRNYITPQVYTASKREYKGLNSVNILKHMPIPHPNMT